MKILAILLGIFIIIKVVYSLIYSPKIELNIMIIPFGLLALLFIIINFIIEIKKELKIRKL